MINVIKKLINVEYSEEEEAQILELIEKTVPDFKKLMTLIYWNDKELTPEQIVEEALSYQPIITPPPNNDFERS
ncbi:hypothetical protein JQC72_06535 [Polycladomyces sp. WAk]|uniref:Uncharacterized protein n=1 Tax=Polycladomyces zharkentensis TaxID=2807616 RepID=A0ABS2WHZ6_9BACL|nr:hypothetical protein [Polycladomyces sp. WAk]MBN2909178.1 hypothetical protein [Polycladomyces sp. WAk]